MHEAHPGLCSRHRLRLRSPRLDDGHVPGRPDRRADRSAATVAPPAPTPRTTPALGAGQGLVVRDTVRRRRRREPRPLRPHLPRPPRRRRRLRRPPERGGAFRSVSGRPLVTFQLPDHAPSVTARTADRAGRRHRRLRPPQGHPRARRARRPPARRPSPGASTSTGRNADGSPAGEYVFVNARKGGVLDQLALRAGRGRHRHRPLRRHRAADHEPLRLAVHAGRRAAAAATRRTTAPSPAPPPRCSPTPTTSGATAPPPTRVGRRRRPLRHRQDVGLLQDDVRPQRHRQRRQGRARVRPRRRLRQRLLERRLLLHAVRRRRRHAPTRWSRSTWPATR